jgi:hypothetical protein
MDESVWLETTNDGLSSIHRMVDHLERDENNQRRLRLFACACCRRIWDRMCRDAAKRSVELAEIYADDEIDERSVRAAYDHPDFGDLDAQVAGGVNPEHQLSDSEICALNASQQVLLPNIYAMSTVYGTARSVRRDFILVPTTDGTSHNGGASAEAEFREQLKLLRDIFGNPFKPVSLDPAWLTSTVVALANGIYTERAFDRMPMLADALEEAGCDHPDVLLHCRGDGPHVKGCWVVDLLLGKE